MKRSRALPLLFLTLLLSLAFHARIAQAAAPTSNEVVVYFFWGDGCPHCAQAEPFLQGLLEKYPNLKVRAFEVWYVEANQELFNAMAEKFNFKPSAVPTIFIADQYWVGFNDTIQGQIEAAISQCSNSGCQDAGQGVVPDDAGKYLEKAAAVGEESAAKNNQPATTDPGEKAASGNELKLPLLGTVNLDRQSLLISTLLISFVDGVNPCSLWVLSMLLALTLHTGSRKKIVIIGLVFLTITALIYALFITGLFTVLSFVSYLGWVEVVIALIALVFGLVNIKDYFFFKEGISFTISDKNKAGIMQRIRKIVNSSESLITMVGATIVLAAGVSLVEFSCTAGFPVMWTNMLTAQKVDTLTFILLMLVYMVIYQLDELVIFFTAVFTLKASKLEEKHGRILKLIGGTLMITLAVVMLINPKLMNDIASSLLIFGAAFMAALLLLLVHRRLLPAMGIWIGSEQKAKKRPARRKHSR